MNQIKSFEQWTFPPTGFIKINVDAAILGEMEMGLQCVALGVDGKVVAMAARRVKKKWDAQVAEAAAALFGVQLARRMEWSSVCLESDALSVISRIQGEEGKHSFGRGQIRRCYKSIIQF